MKVAVGSMWRDSNKQGRIWEQLVQYHHLALALRARGDSLTCLFVENDSTDDTAYQLREFGACGHVPTDLAYVHDDCPYWQSIDHPDRWRHLAWVANHTLDMLAEDDADRFIYVESDLRWEPATMLALLDHLDTVEVVSAVNLRPDGALFDTWGTLGLDGIAPDLAGTSLIEVASAAGCTAMHADIGRTTRFQSEDCYRGWNRDMRDHGHTVWLDPTLTVTHP